MKTIFFFIIFISLFLIACSPQQEQEQHIMKINYSDDINITIPTTPNQTNETNKTTYEIAQMTNISCNKDDDCETPGEFLILSSCSYTSICLDKQCAVICPTPYSMPENQLNNYPKVSVQECSQRNGRPVSLETQEECKQDEMLLGQIREFISPNICCIPKTTNIISKEKAIQMAKESSCAKEGMISQETDYDAQTREWTIFIAVPAIKCFPICVVSEILQKAETRWQCYGPIANNEKLYVSKDVEVCKKTKYECASGLEGFFDESGCGCKIKIYTKHFCTQSDRSSSCVIDRAQTCGWRDQGPTCREPPCVEQYNSICQACQHEEIIYWTQGECPE